MSQKSIDGFMCRTVRRTSQELARILEYRSPNWFGLPAERAVSLCGNASKSHASVNSSVRM